MVRREQDALIASYQHLDTFPRSQEALHMLRKIASVVKPIMRKRSWTVGTLTEFYPTERNLLGLNVNHGQRVCLRLRYQNDNTLFMPLENVIDTMLHELSHNVFGPHNEAFHKLWNDLRDEYTDLKIKGYTGEGFLSEGQRLGGRRVPMHEVRRQARSAAERRRAQQGIEAGSGQKVGGRPIQFETDIRAVIADAVTRRTTITQGCASGTQAGDRIAAEAPYNGFRTKAEEDEANERAINQALWELVQEEEARKVGVRQDGTWNTEGLSWNPDTGLDVPDDSGTFAIHSPTAPPIPKKSSLRRSPSPMKPPTATRPMSSTPQFPSAAALQRASTVSEPHQRRSVTSPNMTRTLSSLITDDDRNGAPEILQPTAYKRRRSSATVSPATPPLGNTDSFNQHADQQEPPTLKPAVYKPLEARDLGSLPSPSDASISPASPPMMDISSYDDSMLNGPGASRAASQALPARTWTCLACTLCNKFEHLACDACGAERPRQANGPLVSAPRSRPARTMSAWEEVSQDASERDRLYGHAPPRQERSLGWLCRCGTFMESRWWTCSLCGRLKESSG